MSTKIKKKIKLEIGHVLFMDIVDYSTRLIDEQRALRDTLNQIVRSTKEFKAADAAGTLIKSPTGDGMALVFRGSPAQPVECAIEISRALKAHPNLPLRMGVHSGPVTALTDVNDTTSVAGAGINMAQRVMDCGDAGHILLSRHVAEDLEQYAHWKPHLHDVGECEVKHGVRLHLVNLYTDELGYRAPPQKLKCFRELQNATMPKATTTRHISWPAVGTVVVILGALAIGTFVFQRPRIPNAPFNPAPDKSIAVLPFENRSEDKPYFADGVQDEILTNLAKIADLKVISRTSVLQYKSGVARNLREIAQQLGVANVVEGSVQRSGNRVRVNVQLVNARTDAHLWAQTYDRDLDDVFAIQSEIAKAIADQLRAEFSPAEKNAIEQRPTYDLTAFDQYIRAKTLLLTNTQSILADKNYLQAIELLNGAVARDPSFYAAFCQLVITHDLLYANFGDHTPARLAAAEAALQRATALRPNDAETHLARGSHLYFAFRDYKGALSELEAARADLPNNPRIPELTGYILRRQGKYEEGLSALEQALALDPRNPFILSQLARSYRYLRRYPEQKATLQRVLEITPDALGVASGVPCVDLDWRADTAPLHQFIRIR